MIKVTNEIKVDMKQRQYEILDIYFKGTSNDDDYGYDEHIKALVKMYVALPKDIERFKELAEMDKVFKLLNLGNNKVPGVIRLGEETRSLEEIAKLYKDGYEQCPKKPLAKEFSKMYEDLVEKYK